MATPIGTWRLGNGISVEVADRTRLLDGGYYQIRLVITSRIPVKEEYLTEFKDSPLYDRILKKLRPTTEYKREIVKTGVEERTLSEEKAYLIGEFEKNALVYFERDDFPAKYVRKQFSELNKK
jgi:hypothetical protein